MEGEFGRAGLGVEVVVDVGGERRVFSVEPGAALTGGGARWVWARAVEFSVPLCEVARAGAVRFFVRVLVGGVESDRACEQGTMVMTLSHAETMHSEWLA
jgi:hypothetical protein